MMWVVVSLIIGYPLSRVVFELWGVVREREQQQDEVPVTSASEIWESARLMREELRREQ